MSNDGMRTGRNVILVSVAAFAQIAIQFLIQRVIAGVYGSEMEADAWSSAIAIPTMFAAMATGSLSYVLIPELVAKLQAKATQQEGWRLASFVGLVTTTISAAIAIIVGVFAGPICQQLYGEISGEQLATTEALLRVVSVQVVLSGLVTWAQAVHHSIHQFAIPALGGVLGTGLTLLLANVYADQGIVSFAWAVNAGSVVSVLVHVLPLATRLGWPKSDFDSVWRLLGLYWPLLLGLIFLRIDPLVDRVLAARLEASSLAYVNYAQRILMALLAIGTSSLSVVAFPQLAQKFEGEGRQGFSEHFSVAFRRLILLIVPISIGFSVFAIWIIADLLQHGEFTQADSRVVGQLTVAFMGMFVGASTGELLARAFYVVGDTKTPTVVGVLSLVVGLVLKFALVRQLGIWGIGLGVSAYCVLSATIMAVILSRGYGGAIFRGSAKALFQSCLATATACGVCYVVYQFGFGRTWLAAPAGAAIYGVVLLALGCEDAKSLRYELTHRLKRTNQAS